MTLPDGTQFGIADPALSVALEALFGRSVTIEAASGPQQGVYESDWPEIEGLTLAGEIDLPTNLTGEGTSFVDLGILHVLTTASMDVAGRAADDALEVDVRRFRPSILIDTPGLEGFPENDDWTGRALTIGTGDDAVEIADRRSRPRAA